MENIERPAEKKQMTKLEALDAEFNNNVQAACELFSEMLNQQPEDVKDFQICLVLKGAIVTISKRHDPDIADSGMQPAHVHIVQCPIFVGTWTLDDCAKDQTVVHW